MEIFDIVIQHSSSTQMVWEAVEDLFCDNKKAQAIQIKAEFPNFAQGDMMIMEYCAKLETLDDVLNDLGQSISDKTLVLNCLRGIIVFMCLYFFFLIWVFHLKYVSCFVDYILVLPCVLQQAPNYQSVSKTEVDRASFFLTGLHGLTQRSLLTLSTGQVYAFAPMHTQGT